MNKQQFISEFEENVLMVEPGTINGEMILEEIEEWDSMGIVSTLALIDGLNVRVSADVLNKCITVNDIISLVTDKLEE
ncbi:acyl carrier protein [Paenibacillus castaneae]|uniref:hypothetical protein n=1 Tax=Paenibacillus castaneae TaxID=474957 RepID=UPI000C9A8206|nr:hypothetical protein [Paenibacillus castaneae]NIK76090.1 acyl carrier protein [Paenibacillus castaneae]